MATNVLDFDRPYAGWFGFLTQVHNIKERQVTVFGVEFGITGKQSGAGNLQRSWHNLLDMEVPTWKQEIGNKFLANFNVKYIYNLMSTKYYAFDSKTETTLGLKDVNISTGLAVVFGKLKNFNNSYRAGNVKTNYSKEFYGVIGFNYKQVIHNAIIQGDLNYNDTRYTTSITKNVLSAKAGVHYISSRYLISLECHFLSKETPRSYAQVYGSLTYGYCF